MKQNFTLSINTPCSEKFENFQKTDVGGFCQSCQTEVIDFTKMTDKEILQFFKNPPQKTCGHFQDFQLKNYTETSPPNKSNLWKAFGIGLMSFSLFSLFSVQESQAKNYKSFKANSIFEEKNEEEWDNISKTKSDSIVVEGVVVDESGEPIPGVTILIKGTERGAATDIKGYFKIESVNVGDILIFFGIGMQSKELKVKDNMKENNSISLKSVEMHEGWTGEVSINHIYQSKPSLWQRIKNLFR